MKQKLALMCTLLHQPQVLFLDEPTNGVDPVSRRDFWAILYELVKDGMTVFVTTAYLDEAERCDRVGLMHRGRLIRCDAPARAADVSSTRRATRSTCAGPASGAGSAARDAPGVVSVEPFGRRAAPVSGPVADIGGAAGGGSCGAGVPQRDRAVAGGRVHRADPQGGGSA